MKNRKIIKYPSALLERKIESVTPIYTGGGIWIFLGKVDRDLYFCAQDCDCYIVSFIDCDPLPLVDSDTDGVFHADWLEKHTIAEFQDTEPVLQWFERMYSSALNKGGFDETSLRLSLEEVENYRY